ncbi:hypothetical protein HXP34_15600 [Ralstonia solanacearum]|uniref:hypothetical protein n=1 Tax=Ralstonia solanacearum TaxID=305 RepID=UPI001681503F|nr:hypothetical protein [Ralstonia solanacearum]MBB6592594.1 hypothetical protein [Ralstonia solanacearum]
MSAFASSQSAHRERRRGVRDVRARFAAAYVSACANRPSEEALDGSAARPEGQACLPACLPTHHLYHEAEGRSLVHRRRTVACVVVCMNRVVTPPNDTDPDAD